MNPPRQRLFVLDFVEAELHAQCIGLGFAQAVAVAVEVVQQLPGVAVGGAHQGLRQGRRHLAADRGVGEIFQQRQATEVSGDVAGAQESGEEFLKQGQVHGSSPRVSRETFQQACRCAAMTTTSRTSRTVQRR
ncbi:hypothetical protein FQZ97_1088520 [compost metagenome]